MCTVSFIPKNNNDFIFTSNRDEAIKRKTSYPDFQNINGVKTLFPKDEISKGTWIGVSEKKRLVCLLNGAFEKHLRQPYYRHSRGKVVKDILVTDDFQESLLNYNLEDIEPFTLIVVDWEKSLQLHELIWDASKRHIKQLPLENKIWSSSTLYTNEMKIKRQNWFHDFVSEKSSTQESILDFHENYEVGDKNIDLKIDRGLLKTISITSVKKEDNSISMKYLDFVSQTEKVTVF